MRSDNFSSEEFKMQTIAFTAGSKGFEAKRFVALQNQSRSD
jgi:hypothetical protein